MNQQTPKQLEEPPYLPHLTPDMPGSPWENAQVGPLRAQVKMRQKQGAQTHFTFLADCFRTKTQASIVVHTYNSRTQEAEEGEP